MNHETRVPHVLQNDRKAPRPIRCGPASIEAILYGLDDTRFEPPSLSVLKTSVPVEADQEAIWTAVKTHSAAVATGVQGHVGATEAEQVCEPGITSCFITHPESMARVLRHGLPAHNLPGRSGIQAWRILEDELAAAVVSSISRGVGAAIPVNINHHWVVAYASRVVSLAPFDVAIKYRDPFLEECCLEWSGIDQLTAAVIDMKPGTPEQQTFMVGERAANFKPLLQTLRLNQQPLTNQPFNNIAAESLKTVVQGKLEFFSLVDPDIQHHKPTRILRIRQGDDRAYLILDYPPNVMTIVDAQTHKLRSTASRTEPQHVLPTILTADELRERVNGVKVTIGAREVTLSAALLRFDSDLFWRACDQSGSMFTPFYVGRQGNDTGDPDVVYVRSNDGTVFSELTPVA